MEEAVLIDFFKTLSLAIAPHIRCDGVESSLRDRLQLMSPRVPRFRETVTQHYQWTCPAFSNVHADPIGFYFAMPQLDHCEPQFGATCRSAMTARTRSTSSGLRYTLLGLRRF